MDNNTISDNPVVSSPPSLKHGNQTKITLKQITYWNCNKHTIVLLGFIFPILIFSGLLVKLFVYSEYDQHFNICNPVDFFWGNKNTCKIFIENTVNNAKNNINLKGRTEGFTTETSSSIFNNIGNILLNLKENVVAIYLAIIDFIRSFNELIVLIGFKIIKEVGKER